MASTLAWLFKSPMMCSADAFLRMRPDPKGGVVPSCARCWISLALGRNSGSQQGKT